MLDQFNKWDPFRLEAEPGLGRMLAVSLGVHLLALILFTGVFHPHLRRDDRPVYYVDLVNLPVKNPQAGRPDAQATPPKEVKKETPAPAPKPPVKKSEPVVVAPKKPAETVKTAKASDKPKAQPKPAEKPKPAAKPSSKKTYEKETLDAVEALRRKQSMEDLKNKLAALTTADTRNGADSKTPLGMPDGKGDEAGPDEQLYIQKFLKENWSLSKYQVVRPDLEARVLITYNATGHLLDYRFIDESGDPTFDKSVKDAILKGKELPFEPKRRLEIEAVFNLKDLME